MKHSLRVLATGSLLVGVYATPAVVAPMRPARAKPVATPPVEDECGNCDVTSEHQDYAPQAGFAFEGDWMSVHALPGECIPPSCMARTTCSYSL